MLFVTQLFVLAVCAVTFIHLYFERDMEDRFMWKYLLIINTFLFFSTVNTILSLIASKA